MRIAVDVESWTKKLMTVNPIGVEGKIPASVNSWMLPAKRKGPLISSLI